MPTRYGGDVDTPGTLRIGELAERLGVSADVLRVWERRYGLFSPSRSAGRYRLYTSDDEHLGRRVLALRTRGVAISDAVAQVRGGDGRPARTTATGEDVPALIARIDDAVRRFDAPALLGAMDEAIDLVGLDDAVTHVVMGYLEHLGGQWAAGELSIAHEHFASQLLRRSIAARGLEHPSDGRPSAVLACPPQEHHDIPLLVLAVLLSRRGWCVRFLGADTPPGAIAQAAEAVAPRVVVISASRRVPIESNVAALARLAATWPLALGGRGAHTDLAALIGAARLPADLPLTVAALERYATGPAT